MDNYSLQGSNIFRYSRRWTICPSLKYKHSSDRCKVNKREASNYDDKGRNDNEALLAWSSKWRCSLNLETHGSPITLEMHYAPERSNRLVKTPIIRCLELISGYICKYSNDHFRARILFRLVKNLTNI